MVDLWRPPRTLPSSSPLLSPNLALLDQWVRLNLGYVAGTAVFAPVLRSVILQIGEREHLRHHHFSQDASASSLRYSSSIASFRDVLLEEGWRGLYRGSGVLFSAIPIRATFHMLLFNLVEQQTLPSNASTYFTKLAHPFDPQNAASRPKIAGESDQLNKGPRSPSPSIFLPESGKHSQYRTSGQRKRSYLAQFAWLMTIGELIIYPSQYLFVTMAGDMVGSHRAILTNRTTSLLLDTLKRDGLWSLYRGFFPTLIATTLPALLYANIRFNYYEEKARVEREAYELEEKERKRGLTSNDRKVLFGAESPDWPTIKDERVDRMPEEPEGDMNRRMREIGAVLKEGESFSFRYALLCALVYPVFITSARMAIGDAERTANPTSMSFLSPEKWPKVRFVLAQILPITSTSYRESFFFTLNRVISAGSTHTFAGMWALVGAAAASSLLASSVSLLSSFPLTAYLNHLHFGSPSLASPEYIVDMQQHISLVQQYHEAAASRVLVSLATFDGNADSSIAPSSNDSEGHNRHISTPLASDATPGPLLSTGGSQVDLYADSDAILERLGLQTRNSSKTQTSSSSSASSPSTASSLDLLNASLSDGNTVNRKSLDGLRRVPSELAGFDLESESLLPPSSRSSSPSSDSPSKSYSKTKRPAVQPTQEEARPSTTKHVPLLSQRKKWSPPSPTSL